MKRKVLVFISESFADWESAYICSTLNAPESNCNIKTLSLDTKPKTSMGGFRVLPDYCVEDFPKEFDLLLLIGGLSWKEKKNNAVLPVVEYASKKHIPIGAICDAVGFLAEQGYLDTIKHSGNSLQGIKDQAPHYKGELNFVEKQAVCDSAIITANGTAPLEFAREILLLLKVMPVETVQEWYGFHKTGFYQA
ncbi:type 1 glutamine amidotransferase family protein [uncultured Sphaerochaeta sp.]|uniref:type 1 glutamine amidotransferase family protein n=1 Tax=uncultured Sphaerochaeta sp. TaxID=886478 RepID=UPI002A0A6902|nr:type 1 glutamine amidotransferase family protein [uncultured Sphaerochaeta sp.]